MAAYPADYPALARLQPPMRRGVGLLPGPAPAVFDLDDDVVFHGLRPVWLAMQAAGFYPIHRLCRGRKGGEPSPWLLLGVLQYAAVLATTVMAFSAVTSAADGEDFDGAIIKYLAYIQCALPAAVLPLYALQRPALARYLRGWVQLQEDFVREAGRPLSSHRGFSQHASLAMVALVSVWLVVVGVPAAAASPLVVGALVLSNLVSGLLAAFWYLHGRILRAAGIALADHVTQVLMVPAPDASAVDAARLLVLRLVSLCGGPGSLGAAVTLPVGLLLLLHFVLQTLTLYALFGQLSHSAQRAARVPGLLAAVVFSGAVLYVCCDTGHRVAAAVKACAVREVMAFRRRAALLGHDLHDMVETFITTVQEVPSDVTLSGVTVINRQLFTAILSTMVTYLVVVVQFRVSLEAKEEVRGGDRLGVSTPVPDNWTTIPGTPASLATASLPWTFAASWTTWPRSSNEGEAALAIDSSTPLVASVA